MLSSEFLLDQFENIICIRLNLPQSQADPSQAKPIRLFNVQSQEYLFIDELDHTKANKVNIIFLFTYWHFYIEIHSLYLSYLC